MSRADSRAPPPAQGSVRAEQLQPGIGRSGAGRKDVGGQWNGWVESARGGREVSPQGEADGKEQTPEVCRQDRAPRSAPLGNRE